MAQLLEVDELIQDAMRRAMRVPAAGLGNSVDLANMENLQSFGFPAGMKAIGATAKAAKLRLYITVASNAGEKCQKLYLVQQESLRRPFDTWRQASFYQFLLTIALSSNDRAFQFKQFAQH